MMNISFGFENPLTIRFGETFLQTVPATAGVYFFLDAEHRPLYIGKANCLKRRLASYFQAKPGQTAEHILEMLEHAQMIVWEQQPDGERALLREAELIRTIKPHFNIALTHEVAFLFCGLRIRPAPNNRSKAGSTPVEFRLSHGEIPAGFEMFGCFLHRGKTKSGYSALLRLLTVASSNRPRAHLPSRLCRTSPAYVHNMDVRDDLLAPLTRLLRGESADLLHLLVQSFLAKDDIEAHHYAPLQRDIRSLEKFFAVCSRPTRALRNRRGVKESFVPQKTVEDHVRKVNADLIARLVRDRSSGSAAPLKPARSSGENKKPLVPKRPFIQNSESFRRSGVSGQASGQLSGQLSGQKPNQKPNQKLNQKLNERRNQRAKRVASVPR